MTKKLIIEFSEEATEKYLKIASDKTTAELEHDCEPSGTKIEVEIGQACFGYEAYANGENVGEVFVRIESEQ